LEDILSIEEVHGKNDFAKGSKILLDTDLKIILLDHQNNEQCCKKFLTGLSILHNYFDVSTKLFF